jgi:hypothetical protein
MGSALRVSNIGIVMNDEAKHEYLVISRGQWDKDASPDAVQAAIDAFYPWLDQHVANGRMRGGSRLKREGATVSRKAVTMDGPYGETKELIGGYWFILADSLEEASRIAAANPCMQLGLFYEIRPLDPEPASARVRSNETPD